MLPLKSPADVYQTIDVFAYGFVPTADVPRPVLPSFARGGDALSPACGAVWSTCGARAAEGGLGYAELSCGRLVLGAVRTSSAVSAELTLRNVCSAPVSFVTCQARRGDQFCAAVRPARGRLGPGEEVRLLVAVEVGALPAVFVEDLAIRVSLEAGPGKADLTTSGSLTEEQLRGSGRPRRLPAVLANTVASAARVSETAILQ